MRYLSVCSGIEAASVAWHPLGWSPVAFAEIEKFPSAVLAHHWPEIPNLGDITRFKDWPDADVDVLIGGTPCQSFSVAGLRKGLADPRGNLALTYLAIADRYRPEWLVWENVPGVLSSNGGRDFGAFLGGLGELGYGFAYRVLDAQYVRVDGFARAVPQRRRRVFVVGNSRSWRRAAAVLFERESLSRDTPPRRETGQRVAGTIKEGSGDRGWANGAEVVDRLIETRFPSTGEVAHCLNAGGMGRQDYETETVIAHALRGEGFDASEDGTGRGTPVIPIDMRQASRGETMTNNRKDGSSGGAPGTGIGAPGDPSPTVASSHTPAIAFSITPSNSNADYNAREAEKAQALTGGGNRPSARGGDIIAEPTAFQARQADVLIYGDKSGPLDAGIPPISIQEGWAVRRLTPTECERLQGFPDGHTAVLFRGKPAADGPRYKALGNSMACNVIRWLGMRIALVDALAKQERAAA